MCLHVQITIFSQILCNISTWFLICQNCRAQFFFSLDIFLMLCWVLCEFPEIFVIIVEKLETLLQLWQHISLFRNKDCILDKMFLSSHFLLFSPLDECPDLCWLDTLFTSNHNIHESLCSLWFWASDHLIERFY